MIFVGQRTYAHGSQLRVVIGVTERQIAVAHCGVIFSGTGKLAVYSPDRDFGVAIYDRPASFSYTGWANHKDCDAIASVLHTIYDIRGAAEDDFPDFFSYAEGDIG